MDNLVRNLIRRPNKPGGVYHLEACICKKRFRGTLKTSKLSEAKVRRDMVLSGQASLPWGIAPEHLAEKAHSVQGAKPAEFWEAYVAWSMDHKTRRTREGEELVWRHFIEWSKVPGMALVTSAKVQEFKGWMKHERGLANQTVNDRLGRVGTIWNHANRWG